MGKRKSESESESEREKKKRKSRDNTEYSAGGTNEDIFFLKLFKCKVFLHRKVYKLSIRDYN